MSSIKCSSCESIDNLFINSRRGELVQYMCRLCNTERKKKYRATPQGGAKTNEAIANYYKRNQEKQRAHTVLNCAVLKGEISKPIKCTKCGASRNLDGHHTNYSNPLEVMWVCRGCHADLHKVPLS